MSIVFIALQATENARMIVDAILEDNPSAVRQDSPGMVKIDAEGSLIIYRETIEKHMAREFDLQEIQVDLITISGHLEEEDDFMKLSWNN